MKYCEDCKYFAPNPYNPKLGACMDSADGGYYTQVKSYQPACASAFGKSIVDAEMEQLRFCPFCRKTKEVGDFTYDKRSEDGYSIICADCQEAVKC